mgnify:CR=1 FL=1
MTPYCGKCHKWLDACRDEAASCSEECMKSCHCGTPDLTKDPNCHNSGHDHHDPESPIVKMDRCVLEIEEAIDNGTAHVWQESKERDQFCTYCDADAAELEDDEWVYCSERVKAAQVQEDMERPAGRYPPPTLDEGYDARRINWPRLGERMLSSTYNALFYSALIVAAKALGIL